jgi:SOS-response transcriptional repressor LexA
MAKRYSMKRRRNDQEQILREVLQFIREFINEHGISPSITEVADGCFRSRSGVVRYLDLLQARGYIERIPRSPRSISLLDEKRRL